MKHISDEKLDVYILNKELLGNELKEIKNHLNQCSTCKKKLEELSEFYGVLKTMKEESQDEQIITLNDVEEKMQSHQLKNISEIKEYFRQSKVSKIRKKIFSLSKLSLLTNFLNETFQNKKLAFGIITSLFLITFTILYYFLVYSPKTSYIAEEKSLQKTKIQEKVFDSTSFTQKDTNLKETQSLEKSKRVIKKQRSLFANIISSPFIIGSQAKGEGQYFTVGFFHKKFKSSAIIIIDDISKKDEISIKEIDKYYRSKKIKYMIIFPKTVINSGKNSICDVIESNLGLNVIVTEEEGKCNFNKDPIIIYKFSENMKIEDIEFSNGFKKKYSKHFGYELQESESDSLKTELKSNIKSLDGKKILTE